MNRIETAVFYKKKKNLLPMRHLKWTPLIAYKLNRFNYLTIFKLVDKYHQCCTLSSSLISHSHGLPPNPTPPQKKERNKSQHMPETFISVLDIDIEQQLANFTLGVEATKLETITDIYFNVLIYNCN